MAHTDARAHARDALGNEAAAGADNRQTHVRNHWQAEAANQLPLASRGESNEVRVPDHWQDDATIASRLAAGGALLSPEGAWAGQDALQPRAHEDEWPSAGTGSSQEQVASVSTLACQGEGASAQTGEAELHSELVATSPSASLGDGTPRTPLIPPLAHGRDWLPASMLATEDELEAWKNRDGESESGGCDGHWGGATSNTERKPVRYARGKAPGFAKRRRQVYSLLRYLGEYVPSIDPQGGGKASRGDPSPPR